MICCYGDFRASQLQFGAGGCRTDLEAETSGALKMAAVSQQQRSPTKFAPADWHTSNFLVSSSAERQRAAAHSIRQESHRLSNDTGRRSCMHVACGQLAIYKHAAIII